MTRSQTVQTLIQEGAVAVIRLEGADRLLPAAEALLEGGIRVLEVTMTTPEALRMIETLSDTFASDALVGVGSVLDGATAHSAIAAGAEFVVSPVLKSEIVDAARRRECAVIPGAFTPTEIQQAHEWGADIVKVFPARQVGPAYLRAVKAPLPHLKLMPTGGVTPANVGDWLAAGACTVGVGSALLDRQAIAEENYAALTEHARALRTAIDEYRT